MRRKRFTVELVVAVLKQAEAEVPLRKLLRRVGVSEQPFFRWKKQHVGPESDQVRQLKQLQEENTRLQQVVADLALDGGWSRPPTTAGISDRITESSTQPSTGAVIFDPD